MLKNKDFKTIHYSAGNQYYQKKIVPQVNLVIQPVVNRLISVWELRAVDIKHLVELLVEHEFFATFVSKRKTCHGWQSMDVQTCFHVSISTSFVIFNPDLYLSICWRRRHVYIGKLHCSYAFLSLFSLNQVINRNSVFQFGRKARCIPDYVEQPVSNQ